MLAKQVSIDPDLPFAQLGIDSMSIIELVAYLERKQARALPDKALHPENLRTASRWPGVPFRRVPTRCFHPENRATVRPVQPLRPSTFGHGRRMPASSVAPSVTHRPFDPFLTQPITGADNFNCCWTGTCAKQGQQGNVVRLELRLAPSADLEQLRGHVQRNGIFMLVRRIRLARPIARAPYWYQDKGADLPVAWRCVPPRWIVRTSRRGVNRAHRCNRCGLSHLSRRVQRWTHHDLQPITPSSTNGVASEPRQGPRSRGPGMGGEALS
ncbi:MAG: acyl carrier protein [Flavobacteriales bacterium]|nr:acyl carrier protein [Flavobacteriales bacterium]